MVKKKIMNRDDIPKGSKIQLINFIEELGMNCRTKTVRNYCTILCEWLKFVPKRPFIYYEYGRDVLPSISDLIQGKAKSSKNIYKFIIKKFFQFVYNMDPAEREYLECVRKLRIKRANREEDRLMGKILEPEEMRRIIECVDNLLDQAMYDTLFDGALRVSELLSMTIENITFDKPVAGTAKIVVYGKTGIREVSPLNTCVPNLKRWIDVHPRKSMIHKHMSGVTPGERQ